MRNDLKITDASSTTVEPCPSCAAKDLELSRLRALESRLTEEGIAEMWRSKWCVVAWGEENVARAVIRYMKGKECTKSDSP